MVELVIFLYYMFYCIIYRMIRQKTVYREHPKPEREPVLLITTKGNINNTRGDAIWNKNKLNQRVPDFLKTIDTELFENHQSIVEDDPEQEEQKILQQITAARQEKILLTVDRDRMLDTGKLLQQNAGRFQNKLVILTSSRTDHTGPGDARFNLGFSLGALDFYTGTGVLMMDGGKLFSPDRAVHEGEMIREQKPSTADAYNLKNAAIFLCGGTVAGEANFAQDGTILMSETDPVEEYVDFLQLDFATRIQEIAHLDSRDMRSRNRSKLFLTAKEIEEDVILITHGTYTNPKSARNLKRRIEQLPQDHPLRKKTVIFTGAMIPLRGYESTDADFNMGYALGVAAVARAQLSPGVYLAMNATFFDPDAVGKNVKTGRFEYGTSHRWSTNEWTDLRQYDSHTPFEISKRDKDEITQGEFCGFQPIETEQFDDHSEQDSCGFDRLGDVRERYLVLEPNTDALATVDELIEEAVLISVALNRRVKFSSNTRTDPPKPCTMYIYSEADRREPNKKKIYFGEKKRAGALIPVRDESTRP